MSAENSGRRVSSRGGASWSSVAFIVESILLLLFLVASLAVLTKVFSASLTRSIEGRTLDAATIAAGSVAEHFAADPTGVDETVRLGDLLVKCDVTEEARGAGTMYHAAITVYDTSEAGAGGVAYALETSRYESNGAAAVASANAAAASESASETAGAADASVADDEGEVA